MQKTIINPQVITDHDPLIQEILTALQLDSVPQVKINLNPDGASYERPIALFAVADGNLQFLMPNLQGRARTYKNIATLDPIVLTMIKDAVEDKEWKYGHLNNAFEVFVPDFVSTHFSLKKQIQHLIIVDDPISALLLCHHGISTVAIPGYPYCTPDSIPSSILGTLTELCHVCSVETISYIVPSDVVKITFKEDIDLLKKPKSVYTSIWNLNIALCQKLNIKFHFGYVNPESEYRRLYDLLYGFDDVTASETLDAIKKEILNTFAKPTFKYIAKYDLHNAKTLTVKEIFGTQDGPVSFYEKHCRTIMGDPFKFGKAIYQYDYDQEKPVYHRSAEAGQFVCISGTYYIRGKKGDPHTKTDRPFMERFTPESFRMKFKYLTKEQLKTLQHQIPYYDSAESVPSHTDYLQDWETVESDTGFSLKFYNMYKKLMHKPKKGSIDLSMKFIKHIFGENEITYKGKTYLSWQLGLDYVKLLYCNPRQKLPILSLVSHVRQTGKTQFWDWMKEILGDNSTHISENDIASQFTSLFAGKLLAVMEETYIEKIQTFERLKELVTASNLKLEKKGKDAFEITNYIKVGISSNKITNFATIDKAETRFWVIQVPLIPKSHYDIHFKTKIFGEIPAFLDYLLNMPYHTECETRSWFADELIRTDALERVKNKSRSQNEILVERTILTYMKMFNLVWCNLSKNDIRDLSQERDLTFKTINLILENKWNKEPSNRGLKYTFYEEIASPVAPDGFEINEINKRASYYTFTLSDFVENLNLNELTLSQIKDIAEHENNAMYPINDNWKGNKNIMFHPAVISYLEYMSKLNPEKFNAPNDVLNYLQDNSDSLFTFLDIVNGGRSIDDIHLPF